ncbi:MAG TPA: glycosyltransferase [Sphingomicrobium sp.]|nr:glycosyltransferase [Sphingomicrobium sp.]
MTKVQAGEVGFVVIGRNEGERLEQCLKSALKISRWVAYADSASSDGSAELAEHLGAFVTRLPADGRLTAARGRNAGYRELQKRAPDCRFVQFLDGDCILQPGWIEAALGFLEANPKVAVVCGRRFEVHPEASIYNAMCDAEWNTPVGETNECGGDALVRCEAYEEVGGYRSELLAGEEPEMSARMRAAGWKIWRINERMTEHDARIVSLRQWWRRTQRGGFGFAQVWTQTKNLPHRLYGREIRSALVWAVLAPILVLLAAVVTHKALVILALPLLYLLQWWRIGRRSAGAGRWTRAGLILLAKFPEAIGAGRYLLAGPKPVPEYKQA